MKELSMVDYDKEVVEILLSKESQDDIFYKLMSFNSSVTIVAFNKDKEGLNGSNKS